MKKTILLLLLCVTAFGCKKAVEGCNDPNAINYNPDAEKNNGTCIYKKEISQSQLDAVTTYLKTVTDTVTAHGDSTTIKDIYASDTHIHEGTLFVKKTYQKVGGLRGNLLKIHAMYKQPTGYYTEGKDWEYFELTPDTSVHKNGVLPTDATKRGKIGMCGSCHTIAPGSDGLFVQ